MPSRGLDPTLGGILPLIGVLLGALATGGVTYLLRRRDERAEMRAIARILSDELESTADYLAMILDARRWSNLPQDAAACVNRETWDAHRLLVARHITDDQQWRAVADAFGIGPAAGFAIAGIYEHDSKAQMARDIIRRLREGAAVLAPLAYREQSHAGPSRDQ